MKILIVDDDIVVLEFLTHAVRDMGYDVFAANSGGEALEIFEDNEVYLVLTDLRMPGLDGFGLMRRVKEINPKTEVIILSGGGDDLTVESAKRAGAFGFIPKPVDLARVEDAILNAMEHLALRENPEVINQTVEKTIKAKVAPLQDQIERLRSAVSENLGIGQWIGKSPSMQQVYRDCMMYHQNPDSPVIIEGETGTGKEVMAKLIHFGDGAVVTPFVDINCAAISKELFESELFGYESGAFTGAKAKGDSGKIEAASDGTLFLDEIGDMPQELQPKLLRVLQEHYYYRVGGHQRRAFRCRLVCATNVNLEAQVEAKTFRQDLFFRLNVGRISIPPLRERKEDILALSEFFLQREATKKRKQFKRLAEDTVNLLLNFPWPGNVRQLEHAIERAVLAYDGEALLPAHLSFLNMVRDEPASVSAGGFPPVELPESGLDLEGFVDHVVTLAMEKFEGNKSKAADYLGISRYALHRRIKAITATLSDD